MAEFGLIRPFDIDNGELDGLRPQECFVLGYELALIDERIKRPEPFEALIHANNKVRIETELAKHGRCAEFKWVQGDVSEDWVTVSVL